MSEILSGLSLIVSVLTLVLVWKIYKGVFNMFVDDVKTALTAQTASITAATARAAASAVSPADQATILSTIKSNTDAIDQIAPAPAQPQP